jgi:MscS family membrane protein
VKWLEVKEDVLFQIANILQTNNLSFAYPTNVQINRNEETEEINLGGILSE